MSIVNVLFLITAANVDLHGTYTWNIDKDILDYVQFALEQSDRINNPRGPHPTQALKAYLVVLGKRGAGQKRQALSCLVTLQRDICNLHNLCPGKEYNMLDITIEQALSLDNGMACRLGQWRYASHLIGMGNDLQTVQFKTENISYHKFILPKSFKGTPTFEQFKELAGDHGNWHETVSRKYSTVSRFVDGDLFAAKRMQMNQANSLLPTHSKRAANLSSLIATLARLDEVIDGLLFGSKYADIDIPESKPLREKVIRLHQVKIFLIIMTTCPARGCEILDMAFDDLLEIVDGEEFMLMLRALLPAPAIPRCTSYTILRISIKTVKDGAPMVKDYQQDTLPEYAAAISLPDVLVDSMRKMLRMDFDMFMDPDRNPHMRIFVGTGTGTGTDAGKKKVFGEGPLTTAAMDTQLKSSTALPACACPTHWLTCYAGRVMAAVCCMRLGYTEAGSTLKLWIAGWFMHQPGSDQADDYAKSMQRLLTCPHVDTDGECDCLTPSRSRNKETAKTTRYLTAERKKKENELLSDAEKAALAQKAKETAQLKKDRKVAKKAKKGTESD